MEKPPIKKIHVTKQTIGPTIGSDDDFQREKLTIKNINGTKQTIGSEDDFQRENIGHQDQPNNNFIMG